MAMNRNGCTISTWTSADVTISTTGAYFYGVVALGSAAASTITVLDGSNIRMAVTVATTASTGVTFTVPIVFSTNLVIDITGTASFAVMYSNLLV